MNSLLNEQNDVLGGKKKQADHVFFNQPKKNAHLQAGCKNVNRAFPSLNHNGFKDNLINHGRMTLYN